MIVAAQEIDAGRRALEEYADFAAAGQLERLRQRAEPLRGARVLHLSSATAGGAAPEHLRSLISLMRDLGLSLDWRAVVGGDQFERVARMLEDGLSGAETAIDESDWRAYLADAERALGSLPGECDAVVVHGASLVGAVTASGDEAGPWIWRTELDCSHPETQVWERLKSLLEGYRATVVAAEGFAPPDGGPATRVVEPAIDPLAPRSQELPAMVAGGMLRSLGLDLTRPFCCQTIRLDRWEDPHPVIDAFGLAKRELPELQLALGCTMQGDPGGDWSAVGELSDYAAGAPDLHLLTSFTGLGAVELNSLERVARVCLQRSLRGDADPDVLEALWKRTPVVAAATDPPPAGVRDGETGYLVRDSEEAAARIVELVRDPALGIELGVAGRELVGERFLLPRLLEDELRVLASVLGGGSEPAGPG